MCKTSYPKHLVDVIKIFYYCIKIVLSIGKNLRKEIYINQGGHQGCSMSETLFKIYIDAIVKEWKL